MLKEQSLTELNTPSPCYLLRNQDAATLQDIIEFQTQLDTTRKKFMKKLHDYIAQMQRKLASLKSEVNDDFTMELRDEDYYRVNMFQLEGDITKLNQSINIELFNLMREENELTRDIQFMKRRVDEWSNSINIRPVKSAGSAYKLSSADTNDPSSEFRKFISSSGGHTGGWDEQDHLIFLRERRKYNGRPKFIAAVHCLLPEISEETIHEHEKWYEKYEILRKEQKEAIKKWRATKQSSLDKKQDSSMDEKEGSASKSRLSNYAAQRDITERIKEWKKLQLLKKAEEEERQREEMKALNEERLRKRELQRAKKSMVNAYKAEKLDRLQAEMLAQQVKELQAMEERAKKNVLLKTFREHDQQLIEKRKMKRFQSEWKEKQRLQRLRNVKPAVELAVERDPQRLLQPTQTWQQHTSATLQHDQTMQRLSLHTIPHLAVPGWRRGIHDLYTQTF